MHIVSAVLTRALGESAFAFAGPKLFAPLGISRVEWPSDSQGNSHGFADLELLPVDAARLGYLWLHRGRWGDTQIIPSEYLTDALTSHAQVQLGIAYGYGFWLYPGHQPFDFEANGRGGQRITIVPRHNLVEVVTAGGADANVVSGLLAPAIRSNEALPANGPGDARLAAAVAEAAEPPSPAGCVPPPSWSVSLAGVRFLVSNNPLGLRTLEITIGKNCEAAVGLGFSDGNFAWHSAGMDGVPRRSVDPASLHLVAVSGVWRAGALELEYDEVARIDDYRLVLRPVGRDLRIHLTERSGLVDAALFATPG